MKKALQKLKETRFAKILVYFIVGIVSYPGLALLNKLRITGTENIENIPKKNVLFISNHQTYFADVITFLHIFSAVKWRKRNKLGVPFYLLNPYTNVNYVAATKTMKSSWLSRMFTWAGAITVQRAWNPEAGEKRKGLDVADTRQIGNALQKNWVINFPQGTTKPFAPGRKGTAFIMKQYNPVVIPVTINGFSRAFDKKGLRLKKTGTILSVRFKEPLQYSQDESLDEIMAKVMHAIEQVRK